MKQTIRRFILFVPLTAALSVQGQVPEDAIRISWNPVSGTARNQALGGAGISLGGDISAVFVNPAGLGIYKTNELVFTPGLQFLNGSSQFRGMSGTAENDSRFNLGVSGAVWGRPMLQNPQNSVSFSLAVNRTASFNANTFYRGENDYSSFSEAFAEEFAYSGLPINTVLYSAPLTLGTKLANYTYLIDTATVNGIVEVVGLPQRDAILAGTDAQLYQEKQISTRGGITEIAFGTAGNFNDKFLLGLSVGVSVLNLNRTSIMEESDLTGDADNNFNYARYREEYEASGIGISSRVGMIYKPADQFRAGLSIHIPTIFGLREMTTGRMEADLEHYLADGQLSVATADSIYTQFGAEIPQYRYDMTTPWKFGISGTYLINAVEDVSQQRGFITADIEYVTHGSSRFRSAESGDDDNYYRGVSDAIRASYKGAFNFRLGGELKMNTFMGRLGFAWYGSPYADRELKARRMQISGGFGYRHRGMFIDLAYVHGMNRDVDFPYRLADKANTFAEIRDNRGTALLTLGFKF